MRRAEGSESEKQKNDKIKRATRVGGKDGRLNTI